MGQLQMVMFNLKNNTFYSILENGESLTLTIYATAFCEKNFIEILFQHSDELEDNVGTKEFQNATFRKNSWILKSKRAIKCC